MNKKTPLVEIKGIGEKTAALFAKLEIYTVGDLLRKYPMDYEEMQAPVRISEAAVGETNAFRLMVKASPSVKTVGRLQIMNFVCGFGPEVMTITFFNMPYLKKTLLPGKEFVFRGKLLQKGTFVFMEQPKIYTPAEYEKKLKVIWPRYSLTKGLTNNAVQKAVKQALDAYIFPQERYPKEFLMQYDLCGEKEAIVQMHFPESYEKLVKARKRIVFDEFFTFIYGLRSKQSMETKLANHFPMIETAETIRFIESLPFRLTQEQSKVWEEMKEDMLSPYCMNRLIQGDVGSGKTVLALLSLLLAISNGYQGALMAPTEVLATQHYETVKDYAERFHIDFSPILLVGSMTAKQKKEAYERIECGEAKLVIGTHAVIQDKVKFKNLAMVVTDEQHRFGVRQRETLAEKGFEPHVCVMSATPIPRTLALILYGNLSISTIKELPSTRKPIKNCVVNTGYREKAYKFMLSEISKGRQVYIICPMALEGEMEQLENVVEYTDKIRSQFPSGVQIAYLHGKMKPQDKKRIMDDFAARNIDILVSTTVIEVGINVPNATVMMVENSERFGLCQLHQLRGRVGRGSEQSYCIFMSANEKKEVMERLSILNTSNDGFFIASEDMRLRGPGDLFGIRQSGEFAFKVGDIYMDTDVLKQAQEAVCDVLENTEKYADFIKSMEISEFINFIDFRSI